MNKTWKKQFITIYIGQAFSLIGSSAVQFAIIWWLTIQTESAITLTLSSIASFLPNMLIGPFAGVWIDRFNRRTVMIAADGLIALSSIILGVVFLLTKTPPIWFIYTILFLRGIGNTFHNPAMQAAIPMLVPADMLTKAAGWGSLVSSVSNMLAPVLGANLMSFLPISSIMLIDVLGAAFAILSLLLITIPDIPRAKEQAHIFSDLKQGFNAMRMNKPFMAVFLPIILVSVLSMPLSTLFPLLVRVHFMGEAHDNSMVEFIFAGGSLISSLILGMWGGMKRRFLMVSLSIGFLGATCLASGALPSSEIQIFAILCFFMGATVTFIGTPIVAYIQKSFAQKVQGKVFSLWFATSSLAMPIGLLIAGPVSEVIGINLWFFWSGIALIMTAFLCRHLTKPFDIDTLDP